jgi:RNA polymerase-interacting CarD/CdnL/TRCF family regulator
MVPVGREESVGLRRPIPQKRLSRLWRILRAEPATLPSDHKERYALIQEKLQDGNFFEIAEAVRDLAWRREEKRHLTTVGKRLYETGLGFLASELAVVQGSDVDTAEGQIALKLEASIADAAA